MLGLYLHIPFCSSICNYCNFNRGLFEAGLKARYVAALAREIRRTAAARRSTRFSSAAARPRCSSRRKSRISSKPAAGRSMWRADAEVTLETNPETSTPERMDGFRAAGVNRDQLRRPVVPGDELERLGRIHSAERARDAVREARAAGFDNVSLDLMMWLPQQTAADWRESVEALIDVAPDARLALPARAVSERAAEGGDGARRLVAGARRRCGGDVFVEPGAAGGRRVTAVRDFERGASRQCSRATT